MTKFAPRTLQLFFLGLVIARPVCAQKKLTTAEAKQHFGETATVCGEVVSARYAKSSKGHPTFLNLDKPYPKQIFTVVIWDENRNKFGKPEEDYKGKQICASGKITAYAGLPEIVVSDPKQIKVKSCPTACFETLPGFRTTLGVHLALGIWTLESLH